MTESNRTRRARPADRSGLRLPMIKRRFVPDRPTRVRRAAPNRTLGGPPLAAA
ncbi:hypothetical protein [Antiquaquibacter soli]|uniref:Uncharacterized protein n=1 Tax=Antiquaquibacter soli TaxID=3064523 RepID=A0ABT9BK43_9MICO|nr:hypothetical protein [Protaetiibacter sp. WY-16]MDO7880808.1 hypothetical protein [Protaetiibacter sp. WY-16]